MSAPVPTATVERPAELPTGPLPSLAGRARWLARFTPPFAFGDFFSPEDTVLCAVATAWALRRHAAEAGRPAHRLVELTCGGAVVAFAQALGRPRLRIAGADVDPDAIARACHNAAALGLGDRARFAERGLFDRRAASWLRRRRADVVACNPPYVPEPPDTPGALVAGAGADGAEHPRRTLDLCARAGVRRLVLSWCSLGDPVGVVRHAAGRGWRLEALWVAAIPDGEWTGSVHGYLRTLPTCYLHEGAATLERLGPGGAARFAYLLLCGSFVRDGAADDGAGVQLVDRLSAGFRERGLAAVVDAQEEARGGAIRLRSYVSDRWDELAMRGAAHGPVAPEP
jgi:hypothetical protein